MLLTKLRRDLQFNGELLSLVDTLKNIAGSQYHLMEREKERFDLFMNAFSDFFRVVDLVNVDAPLVRVVSNVTGVVVITSDSGFMGGLNQGVIRAAFERVAGLPPEQLALVIVGDKGAGLMRDRRLDFKFFPGVSQDRNELYERAVQVKDYVVGEVLARRMGRVVIAHPRALSFTAQTIQVTNLLPCGELFDRSAVSEVSRRTRVERLIAEAQSVTVESTLTSLLEYLASVWVSSKLFEIFEDSKLAEFSARAMHLEGSVQKIEKEHKKLKQMCFKASHERVDKGMREGFAAKSVQKRLKKASAA
jgi:ATP synthase F1 gamma subunit